MKEVIEKTEIALIREASERSMTYEVYRALVDKLAEEGKSTGPNQTEALTNYTQLNSQRMRRWDKKIKIDDTLAARIAKITSPITWIVLTESWCGDASPSLPVMQKIAALNPNITLKVVLRDENLELMNRFLTNNAMSIPKLITVNDATNQVDGVWGPRPSIATQMVIDYKAAHGQLTPEFKQDLQVWYNKNKGENILEDLIKLLPLE